MRKSTRITPHMRPSDKLKDRVKSLEDRLAQIEVQAATQLAEVDSDIHTCIICHKTDFADNMIEASNALMVEYERREGIECIWPRAMFHDGQMMNSYKIGWTQVDVISGIMAHKECLGVEPSDDGKGWNFVKKGKKK